MAQNWDAPPPPPPPPGPPPQNQYPQQNQYQQQNQYSQQNQYPQQNHLADKNAAYLAKIRAKQKQRASFNPPVSSDLLSGPDSEPQKISLFGNGFLANANIKNNIAKTKGKYESTPANTGGKQPKKSSKYVELPATGLTEKQLFTKYRIESNARIGQGAFARIKVVMSDDDTKYALKMVKKKGKSRSDIEAFKKEILYLSKLTNHPNIIKMYDFCDSPQGLYMVLEFCNGGDVMQKLELEKNFSETECKHIIKQLVAGLCYFHEFNIVHRDLKLDNLMYNNGILKIIDFGLAGDCTNGPLNTPCGTIHFTAPEVLCSYDYTIAADMWSLGVVIYLLICGFPPFFDNQGNEQKLFQIIKRAKFNFIGMYFDQCDASLKELISDLLKKRPIERLTAQEVRKCEWFTGIKQPKKKVPLVPFLDNDDNKKNDNQVINPFLNDNKPKQPVAPYLQYQQAMKQAQQNKQNKQKKNVPPYMKYQQQQQQQQQQQNKSQAPPGAPGSPGTGNTQAALAPGQIPIQQPGGPGASGYQPQKQQQQQQMNGYGNYQGYQYGQQQQQQQPQQQQQQKQQQYGGYNYQGYGNNNMPPPPGGK